MEGPATRISCEAANQSSMRLLILANVRSVKRTRAKLNGTATLALVAAWPVLHFTYSA